LRDDDRVRIRHMIDAADALAQFIDGRSVDDLDRDRMLLFAVVRAVEIVGEAASKTSAETQAQLPDVPWSSIVGMRNRLIHGYFDINTEILWKTATVEVPALLGPLRRVLSES
jgi:uncharacterized protein with HEPN domain